MTMTSLPHGTRVEIKRDVNDTLPYLTTVASSLSDKIVLLDIIRIGGEEARLSENSQFVVRFFTERGVYKFDSLLNGYTKKGEYEFMMFRTLGAPERIQRRQAYRLPRGEENEYKVFDKLGAVKSVEKGLIRDISSSGIRMYTTPEFEINDLLYVQLPMIDNHWSYGTVLSKREMTDSKYKWQYGIEFMGMTEMYTEKIIKFVLTEQQKARARATSLRL